MNPAQHTPAAPVGADQRPPVRLPGTARVLGVPVHVMTMDAVLDACERSVRDSARLSIGVVNAAKLVNMRRDEWLRRAVLGADLILADGQSVVWASRLLHQPLPERVAGIDLFQALLERAERHGYSVYFLGATDEVLDTMVDRLRVRHPRLRISGRCNGYFPMSQATRVAEDIRAARPDLLFVGMTSPRKELFLEQWGGFIGAHVCHGVGGSFDVLAGVTRRAPRLWRRLGLEWLYRVKQEPRRLWRRYLTTNVAFVALLTKDLLAARRLAGARTGPGGRDAAGVAS